ncbi:MAG: L-histidine N(alpha)-methyltransferase [Isosphaerales bacterium]
MTPPVATISRHDQPITWRGQFMNDVVHGLCRPQKEIPCKYFYDAIGSALFDEICELDEYYLTRTELAILRAHAPEMAAAIGEDCELIEFGSGSGIKTRLLLDQVRAPRAYVPIDVAREPIEQSALALAERFPGLLVLPVHADFTAPLSLPPTGLPRARRVVYFPGSTIGNFSPRAAVRLLRAIARLAGDGGGLLVGFDLDKHESIVWPAYNDNGGVTAAFNLNLLARINRELDADFDLEAFAHRATYVREKERVEIHLVSRSAQLVQIAGLEFGFDEGETIHTEYSHKYTLEHFGRMTSRAGFTLVRQWLDPMRYFAVQYLIVV